MGPRDAPQHISDGVLRHAELKRQFSGRSVGPLTDVADLRLVEFGGRAALWVLSERMPFPSRSALGMFARTALISARRASFGVSISDVVPVRTEPQMVDVDAEWNVAGMAYAKTSGYRSDLQRIGQNMDPPLAPVPRDDAVACMVTGSGPYLTTTKRKAALLESPENVCDRLRLHWHLRSADEGAGQALATPPAPHTLPRGCRH